MPKEEMSKEEEDFIRESEQYLRETGYPDYGPPKPEPFWSSPAKIIIALIISFMLILMVVPYYAVKIDPQPKRDITIIIPHIENVSPPLSSIEEVVALEITQPVRNTAVQIASKACDQNRVCYAKALFYFVRDEIRYISDPPYEYIQHPEETLLGGGDCEDQAILLYSFMDSIGIYSRIVIIPGHAYLQVYLPDAARKYRDSHGWVSLDPTCAYCDFGEIPIGNADKRTRYILSY